MTYVVGISIKQLGISAIFSDTRCRGFDAYEGRESPALKNGLLFAGCIYGAAGSARDILYFVERCTEHFESQHDARGAWNAFGRFIEEHEFGDADDFEMLLSSNASGVPILYLLDPASRPRLTRLSGESATMASIGKGKKILDNAVNDYLESRQPIALGESRPEHHAYGLCAQLMHHARGFPATTLEKYEVGGFFNFWLQTATDTRPQEKCLYVTCDVRGTTIHTEFSRIGCLTNGKFVIFELLDRAENFDSHIMLAPFRTTAADIGLSQEDLHGALQANGLIKLSRFNLNNDVTKRLGEKFRASPIYHFCSVSFADPKYPFVFNHFREKDCDPCWVVADDEGIPNAIRQPSLVPHALSAIIGAELNAKGNPGWPKEVWAGLIGVPCESVTTAQCYEMTVVGDPS